VGQRTADCSDGDAGSDEVGLVTNASFEQAGDERGSRPLATSILALTGAPM
jgi:hypothetical protein